MLGVDAIVVVFYNVLDQEMLIYVDEFSHVLVLSSEATNVANGKVIDDR